MAGSRSSPPTPRDVLAGIRFTARLVGILRRPVTIAEAHAAFRERLELREANFLAQARDAIYAVPSSPYRRLLGIAGCELGDLERLVAVEGLEGALWELY